MTGMKEILVSFIVAFATLGTFAYLKKEITRAERRQNDATPTQAAIAPETSTMQLNWGIEAISLPKTFSNHESDRITIAVIDTGCDIHHPALSENIWRNPGESGLDEFGQPRATNGIDDDGNGWIDDVYGWNFAENSPEITDEHGHGTHIAGIIAAARGKGFPVSGVSPNVSLMILKYYDQSGSGSDNLANTIQAIRYAVKMGANIINYSGGGLMKSQEEEDTLAWAAKQGVLIVAAAGNEGLNSDFFPFYPADYDLPNIISVGAIDRHGQLMDLSNFGVSTVDIAAPGKNIYSTLPGGVYGYMTGTSQATAFVTGVAALLMSQDESLRLKPDEVAKRIRSHGRPISQLKTKLRSGSVLNAALALQSQELTVAAGRKPAENKN